MISSVMSDEHNTPVSMTFLQVWGISLSTKIAGARWVKTHNITSNSDLPPPSSQSKRREQKKQVGDIKDYFEERAKVSIILELDDWKTKLFDKVFF